MGYVINYRKSAGRFGENDTEDERDDTILHRRPVVGSPPRRSSVATIATVDSSIDDESSDPTTNRAFYPIFDGVGDARSSSNIPFEVAGCELGDMNGTTRLGTSMFSSSSSTIVQSLVSDIEQPTLTISRQLDGEAPPSSLKDLRLGKETVYDEKVVVSSQKDDCSEWNSIHDSSHSAVSNQHDTDETIRWGTRTTIIHDDASQLSSSFFDKGDQRTTAHSSFQLQWTQSPTTAPTVDENWNGHTGRHYIEESSVPVERNIKKGLVDDGDEASSVFSSTAHLSLLDEEAEQDSLGGTGDGWSSDCYGSDYEFYSDEEDCTTSTNILLDNSPLEFQTITQDPTKLSESWNSGRNDARGQASDEEGYESHEKTLEALMALAPTTRQGPVPSEQDRETRKGRGSLRLLRHVRNSVSGIRGRRVANG
jgi:hypothetical protein